MPIYNPPDIRKQKIEDAEAFLVAKRARRMIVLQTYKQKRAEKLGKVKDAELVRFNRQCERMDKAMDRITEELRKFDVAIKTLIKTHNGLVNIESEEKLL